MEKRFGSKIVLESKQDYFIGKSDKLKLKEKMSKIKINQSEFYPRANRELLFRNCNQFS
jgi:hypothetical protein